MDRAVLVTASLLVFAGVSLFAYKHVHLGMALAPDPSARVWRVDLRVAVEGDGRPGRVELVLPRATPLQDLLDEESVDANLELTRLERDGRRMAVWSGRLDGRRELLYSLRVHLPLAPQSESGQAAGSDTRVFAPIPESVSAAPRPPAPAADAIVALVERLGIERGDDPDAIIASSFGFLVDEIESVREGSDDPRVVLAAREGTTAGKARLLHAMLVSGGLDARLGRGLRLPRSGRVTPETFVEVRDGAREIRLAMDSEGPHRFPRNFLTFSRGDRPALVTSGFVYAELEAVALREAIRSDEMAAFVSPTNPTIRSLSLYRLPVETRNALRTLLVIPLAVFLASVFRNLIGIRTFGTFMPVLIALSLREVGLAAGVGLIATCLGLGVVGRLMLDRLRLLFVPRICLLLCLVILAVTVLAQFGHAWGLPDLGSGLLFPIVILAMLIERISVTTLEEGWQSSALLLAGSLALAAVTYPIFRSEFLGHLFFGFPELVLCVMGALVLVGGYTGYRLADLWRFRSLAVEPKPPVEART